jgi:hypothetical protein
VPVGAIDLSGHGASMFSFWQDPTIGTGISQAQFDVVVGRTSYEVVQAQTSCAANTLFEVRPAGPEPPKQFPLPLACAAAVALGNALLARSMREQNT